MAVVTGNIFSYQKGYTANTSLISNKSFAQIGLPLVKNVYPYETGGAAVASPTTFSEQKTYSPNSFFEGNFIKTGVPQMKEIYTEIGLVLTYQKLYTPNSLSEIRGKQSYKYAVTGIDTPTITTFEFWS